MISMNKVVLAGYLAKDPVMNTTPKGTHITHFLLGVKRTFSPSGSAMKDELSFFEVDAFGRQAVLIANHFKMGDAILIEGRMKQERWRDRNDFQKEKVKVIVEALSFLDKTRINDLKNENKEEDQFRENESALEGAIPVF